LDSTNLARPDPTYNQSPYYSLLYIDLACPHWDYGVNRQDRTAASLALPSRDYGVPAASRPRLVHLVLLKDYGVVRLSTRGLQRESSGRATAVESDIR
jgi:hypothetical protein